MHAKEWDKESQNILPGRKIIEDFFVKKYDEASDANRTDKLPQKKVWHENNRNGRDKGSRWLNWCWNQEGINDNNDRT